MFTHLDKSGKAKMVDISEKSVVHRTAIAKGEIILSAKIIKAIKNQQVPKGDVLTVAKLAGIQAAKRTAELIPLCHPIQISNISIEFELKKDRIIVEAQVTGIAKTGFEMEALTAVTIACLTIYDMCKAVDKQMIIQNIRLIRKWKAEK